MGARNNPVAHPSANLRKVEQASFERRRALPIGIAGCLSQRSALCSSLRLA